ncbi:MAG: hypothetical protein ACOYKN_16020 [Pirellula sp.]
MSSNHHPPPLSGVVTQRGIPVGGLAIPSLNSSEFIQAFNQQYESLGLHARVLPGLKSNASLPIPPDPQTDGIPYDPNS